MLCSPHVRVSGLHGPAWRVSGPRQRALIVRRSRPGYYGVRYAHAGPHSARLVRGSRRHVLALCERFARRYC